MGTDIHVDVEVKIDGEWHWVLEGVPEGISANSMYRLPTDRNYDFFGYLAGVRNGSGFVGVDTGNPVEPIAAGRGWPDDMSDALREAIKSSDCRTDNRDGYHSKTYVTATELAEADPEGVVRTKRAFVPKSVMDETETGEPPEGGYCGDCGGASTVKITLEEYQEMDEEEFDDDKRYMVHYEWEETIRDGISFNRYWSWFCSPSFGDCADDKIEETRFIIGFDS